MGKRKSTLHKEIKNLVGHHSAKSFTRYCFTDESLDDFLENHLIPYIESEKSTLIKSAKPKPCRVGKEYSTSVVDRIAFDSAFDIGVSTYEKSLRRKAGL